MFRTLTVALAFAVALGSAAICLRAQTAQTPQEVAASFVGAAACKDCHEDVHKAWSATKHARAFDRLGKADRESTCIKCHVTGTPEMIAAEGPTPTFPGVQCESCHGAGRAHVEAARSGDASNARTAPITETTCTRCHNTTSPHYKPFFFEPLKPLVHRKS